MSGAPASRTNSTESISTLDDGRAVDGSNEAANLLGGPIQRALDAAAATSKPDTSGYKSGDSRSGDSPPPPELKIAGGAGTRPSAGNNVGPRKEQRGSSNKPWRKGKGKNLTMGQGKTLGNSQKKYQFYQPIRQPDGPLRPDPSDLMSSMVDVRSKKKDAAQHFLNKSEQNIWGSSRSSQHVQHSMSDLDASFTKHKKSRVKQAAGGGGGVGASLKGIDPPERELPTRSASAKITTSSKNANLSVEDTARLALDRLQHRGHRDHSNQNMQGKGSTAPRRQSSIDSTDGLNRKASLSSREEKSSPILCPDPSSDNADPLQDLIESDMDEEAGKYHAKRMEPIESDDEGSQSPSNLAESDFGSLKERMQELPQHESPRQHTQSDSNQMREHPSSAPVNLNRRLPPKQLMQYLHAGGPGRGFAAPQAGSRGLALPFTEDSSVNQHHPRQSRRQSLNQELSSSHGQHQSIRHEPQKRSSSEKNLTDPHLYRDGIHLLEKTAAQAPAGGEEPRPNDGRQGASQQAPPPRSRPNQVIGSPSSSSVAQSPGAQAQQRMRPVLTAASTIDFVVSGGVRPFNEATNPNGEVSGMRQQVEYMESDNEDDTHVSEDLDDFERQTSLSYHAEAKLSGQGSRYAEDKFGCPSKMSMTEVTARMDRLPELVNDPNSDGGLVSREACRDPPDVGEEQHYIQQSLSPSVYPKSTMQKQLYAVETVIPTQYGEKLEHPMALTSDDPVTRARGNSMAAQEDQKMMNLGPRNSQAGGTTGVVLDSSNRDQRDAIQQRHKQAAKEYSLSDDDGFSQSQTSDDLDSDPASVSSIGPNDPEFTSEWNDGYPYESSRSRGSSHGDRGATSLMLRVCSHLLPVGLETLDDRSHAMLRLSSAELATVMIQNKSALIWDDDDPDEPGYVVHRLSNNQLIGVENAYEQLVSRLEQNNVKSVQKGRHDSNFERDLEEAELILDQEEQRQASKKNIDSSTKVHGSSSGSVGSVRKEILEKLENFDDPNSNDDDEVDGSRESVLGFPGIYPPGKGKSGEMECFYLPIITKSQKTGFEPTKDLSLKAGTVFANNYLVQGELGSAAFSTAYRCLDLSSEEDEDGYQDEVCLKVIKNTKDYFDQSLDEIKILQLLKDTGQVAEHHIVEMRSFFYHREHLVIVTELLRQNLYEFGKSILESRGPLYFTRLRLSHIARQCLIALNFVHELGLMHCDIKPENILLESYSRALVKVIDFGSSSFVTDRQSSYIQSRSYRAPEVILGLPYGGKIDIWSLGCVVAEMYTGEVTFQNDSEVSMLSRIEAICGPFPRHMIDKGRNCHRIFTDSGLIYEKTTIDNVEDSRSVSSNEDAGSSGKTVYSVFQPKVTTISARLGFDEDFMDQPKLDEDDKQRALFVDFVSKLLTVDPDVRPSAAEALQHPWILGSLDLTEDDIRY
ncbi:hypothetical protein THAOC_03154 [Thalassiosira oceanica]|uniref:Protein kinase domain-containing protein n=1 Tax=Thalassiosira oceanica TaxID=159749 RepID=K0T8V0_THAOC|nr:hypothetical protein THAOC_03154 [Thalassiosira oceanica]|eukprot:EJK75133.1 hypothetical protein THAOC_03154 [Thalassiosira oceanica]